MSCSERPWDDSVFTGFFSFFWHSVCLLCRVYERPCMIVSVCGKGLRGRKLRFCEVSGGTGSGRFEIARGVRFRMAFDAGGEPTVDMGFSSL